MKTKLFTLMTVIAFLFSGYAFANEDMNHDEHMESMQNTQPNTVGASQVVEVGNTICPVSGNKVDDGKMGEVVKHEYQGKVYNLCCSMCVKDFKKDPKRFSKIAEKEVKEQAAWTPTKEKKHR